ncbi:MAG: hypothetical protein FWF83_07165 [Clostridiales bacterium]|nr:hypothetical protein [Clostridiales bacterium]
MMKTTLHIPFTLRGIPNTIEVQYYANEDAHASGLDALQLPFDHRLCVGYPVMHAWISHMPNTGYRRYCGWIQLIEREYYSHNSLNEPDECGLSIDAPDPEASVFFAFGYPAEIFDAPCYNLGSNSKGIWTAYTYLVDMPSRMNEGILSLLTGFQWGYHEELSEGKLVVELQDLKVIDETQRKAHVDFLSGALPKIRFGMNESD